MDKKRIFLYSIFAAAAIVIAGIVFYVMLIANGRPETAETGVRLAAPDGARGVRDVFLYFGDAGGDHLVAEKRRLEGAADPVRFGRNILEALIKGPVSRNLEATIPEETVCRALHVTDDGLAYVDFSGALREKHPGGSGAERFTIYSVVNSLVLNMNEVKQVKILVDGRETETLAGHIDLRLPFEADLRIIQ